MVKIIPPQNRIYPSDNIYDIPNLLLARQPSSGLLLPFAPWGATSRCKKDVSTYHFYVDDYRFENIWKRPDKVAFSGCREIVEPNFTLHSNLPLAYGLQYIYKKRWLARWFQELGIAVWVDLKVSDKYREFNLLGVPDGYNAFATRGYADNIESLEVELLIAKRISGFDIPNMLVYGGGREAQEFCQRNGLLYCESYMKIKRMEGKLCTTTKVMADSI